MIRMTFDPELPHRYIRYGRMSDEMQNPRSPDQQYDTVSRLIERQRRPWVYLADYRDDAISGRYVKKRPGFQRMLTDIRSGAVKPDLILVDTLERFGRVDELESIRRELLNRHGVIVLSADNGFADPTTPAGKAMASFEAMRAVQDGHVKAHNVLRGKRDAALRGQWPGGPPPLGMRLKSVIVTRNGRQEVDHCVLEHDPESGWIVLKMFALARDTGWGSNRLARALNEDPEVPAKFKPFNHSGVAYVLGNPIYIGELLWAENATDIIDDTRVIKRNVAEDMTRVPDFCEPLVSRDAWDAVAELRRLRSDAYWRSRRKEGSTKQIQPAAPGMVLKYLLTGLVRCGECGRSMRPMPSGRRSKGGKSYTYYACPGALAGGCPNKTYVPEAWLREAVIARLRARLFPAPGVS